MGNLNFMSKETAYKYAEKFCKNNGYSVEALNKLDFRKSYPYAAFIVKKDDLKVSTKGIRIEGKESRPITVLIVSQTGEVILNEKEKKYLM